MGTTVVVAGVVAVAVAVAGRRLLLKIERVAREKRCMFAAALLTEMFLILF